MTFIQNNEKITSNATADRGMLIETADLKPCPFCGAHRGTYPLDYPNWNTAARVYCECCGAEIEVLGNVNTVRADQEKAVDSWNRRMIK